MAEWKSIQLGDLIDFNPKESIRKGSIAKKISMDKLDNFGKKINGFEFSEYTGNPKFKNGDTLLAKITPCLENGKTAQVDILEDEEIAFGSTEFIVLRENENSCNDFIFYLAKSPIFRKKAISCMEGTSGRKRVNENALKLQEIPVPGIKTQQKIASVLSSLDAKIELDNRINSELESMAKTLYDYWFVQFDFPDENGNPYKSSGGAMEYNAELKREIPKGWEVKKLGKVLKTALGGTPSTDEQAYWKNATIPWLSSGEIASFPIIQSDQFITQKGIENSAAVLLPKGSVVISIVRYIRPSILSIDACTNQSVVGIYETEKLKNTYIYPAISKEVPKLMAMRTGAQQPHINKGAIDNIQIFVPSDEVLTKYYKFVDPLYNQITNIALQNQQLAELRDWLLPMLMNGQVKVMDNTVTTNGKYR